MKVILVLLGLAVAVLGNPVGTLEEGPACPIADPLIVEPGTIELSLPPMVVIDEGSWQNGGIATGLSTLYYKYTINILTLRIDFEVTIDRAAISGSEYTATGVIDARPFRQETIPSGPFTGRGSYEAAVTVFRIEGHAILLVNLITNRLTIRVLQVRDFSFATISANIQGLTVAGEQVNWATWNANIKANFEADWATHNLAIVEQVRLSVNEEMKKYTLAEFLELIGGGGGEPEPCPEEKH